MKFAEIDEAVLSFYKNCRSKKLHVSRKRLRLYAKQVYIDMVKDGRAEGRVAFAASEGWISKFSDSLCGILLNHTSRQ